MASHPFLCVVIRLNLKEKNQRNLFSHLPVWLNAWVRHQCRETPLTGGTGSLYPNPGALVKARKDKIKITGVCWWVLRCIEENPGSITALETYWKACAWESLWKQPANRTWPEATKMLLSLGYAEYWFKGKLTEIFATISWKTSSSLRFYK